MTNFRGSHPFGGRFQAACRPFGGRSNRQFDRPKIACAADDSAPRTS
jgi:hypothetical protein